MELDPANVERVQGRRVTAEQAGDRIAVGAEGEDDREQQRERGDGPEPAHATTLKKPIQPSSVNSDWWAWNMNVPVWVNSISRIPR